MSAVLIADDDSRVRDILARWLTPEGYETRQAPDAETAVELLKAGDIGMVLCDVTMPGQGGLWLIERMRGEHPTVAVVLATGVEHVHPSISLAGNVVHYLVKPFERAMVLSAVALARDWHEAAMGKSEADAGKDALTAWLATGRPEGPERK